MKSAPKLSTGKYLTALAAGVAVLAAPDALQAVPPTLVTVPNGSFEQAAAGPPFFVNINIESWQKPGRPAYFPAGGSTNGFQWVQTAGVFTSPYVNGDGAQAAYILSFPQAGVFQDFNTVDYNDGGVPPHDFNALYEVGKSYTMTIGLFGKNMVENVASLELSLYYRDGFNAIVPVGDTLVTFNTTTFNPALATTFVDFSVTVPTVQADDLWAGEHIGIKIASISGDGNGYWDMDNIRLEVVPEPATLSLLAVGAGGLWLARRRACKRA